MLDFLFRSSVPGFSAIFKHLIRHHFDRDIPRCKRYRERNEAQRITTDYRKTPASASSGGTGGINDPGNVAESKYLACAVKAASVTLFWYMRRTTAEPPVFRRDLTRKRLFDDLASGLKQGWIALHTTGAAITGSDAASRRDATSIPLRQSSACGANNELVPS
jgi:hypothetical protein